MRIATYNLRHDVDRWPERLPVIVANLVAHDADVIALQEAALRIDQARLVMDALNAAASSAGQRVPYRVLVQPKRGWRPREGIAVLTRLPIRAHERLPLRGGGRVAQRVRVDAGGWTLDVFNTHLHHLPPHSERMRLRQIRAILAWMAAQPFPAEGGVLLGDMNAWPHSKTITTVADRLPSAYVTAHGQEPARTFPTPLPPLASLEPVTIDYIFCSPSLNVRACWLIGETPHPEDAALYGSDHYGLAADISPR